MREGAISEADLERMKKGYELFNQGDFDALRDLVSDDVVLELSGDAPLVRGWEALRAFVEPDAFEWQRNEPLRFEVNGDKLLIHLLVTARGAGSGLELEAPWWHVWTIENGLGVHLLATADEATAEAAAGLGQNGPRDRIRPD
jgi:ketosteroid isomerase-like protein